MTPSPSTNSPVYRLADEYVERFAALDPLAATGEGITGHDHEMTDYSPDGAAERAEHDRATLRALAAIDITTDADRIAAEVMRERLELALTEHDAGERLRDLRVLGSPVQTVRMAFDLMGRDTADDWQVVAERLALVPQGLSSIEAALSEGAAQGIVAARRQAVACTKQADTWGGRDPATRPFFLNLVDEYDASGLGDHAFRDRLEQLAERATAAYAALGRFLVEEYAPHATERDPVGRERYAMYSQDFNGITLDLDETYAWGWEELHRIEHAMGQVAERIIPGADVDTVIEHLETDPTRAIEGVDEFRRWNQELLDRTVAELDGVHFDIPEPVRRVEAMIAPPGGAAAMYYTGPAEDFSRPGRTWYPTLGKTRFPLWGEVSICYHEGVPGHHLQIAQVRYLADSLSRFQRTLAGTSGHARRLGALRRAAHGRARLPRRPRVRARHAPRAGDASGPRGRRHRHAPRARHPRTTSATTRARRGPPSSRCRSWSSVRSSRRLHGQRGRPLPRPPRPGHQLQGRRTGLARRRDAARARRGASFDLKEFHRAALDLGPMGLDQLDRELARL